MKYLIILFFISFTYLNCCAYEWIEIGDFNEPVSKYFTDENNNFQVVGVEEGLYLNTDESWEYYHRNIRVYDIVGLDSTNLLIADGQSFNGTGLWKFDIETYEYSLVIYAWYGWKILHCNDNFYYIAGDYWQSSNGLNWNSYDYWDDDFVHTLAAFENHVVVSTTDNVYYSEDEGITFNPAEPVVVDIGEIVFTSDGVLYGRTPYDFEDSIIWVSNDYGVSWSELFNDTYIGWIGVDSADRLFVGWRGYPEEYSGIAYWDEQAQEMVYLNDTLPNLEINRIQPYVHDGDPSVICCTQEGLYYLTDYVSSNDNEISIGQNIKISNYPNPFNPSTTISFSLNTELTENTELIIYNLKGQKIKQYSILNNQSSIEWNGTDQNNQPVSSGIYFYKLRSGEVEASKKMLLLK